MQENSTGDKIIQKRATKTCRAVQLAAGRALYRLIGIKQGEDFYKRLNEELIKAQQLKVNGYRDVCYANILKESLKH